MTPAEFRDYLERREPELIRYAEAIRHFVEEQLKASGGQGLLKVPAKPRAKDHGSAIAKIIKKKYDDPVRQMTDIVGLRFVVLLDEEVGLVSKIIEGGPWDASLDRDYEKEKEDAPTTFTYQSKHYVLRARDNAFSQEVEVEVGTPCEVQVRTLLQHAYSELTHDTVYKPGGVRPPAKVVRLVARSMALIESTDSLFMDTIVELRNAEAPAKAWFDGVCQLYREVIGEEQASPIQSINFEFRHTYESVSAVTDVEQLRKFWLGSTGSAYASLVKRRASSTFLFGQPMVLALYPALRDAQRKVTKLWPFHSLDSEFDSVYSDLGLTRSISP